MKNLILSLLAITVVETLHGQLYCPDTYSKKKPNAKYNNSISTFQVGFGAGLTTLKVDRRLPNANGLGSYFNFDYRITKGLFLGARAQIGSLWIEPGAEPLFDNRSLFSRYTSFGGGVLIYPFDLLEEEDNGRGALSIKRYFLNALYIEVDVMKTSNRLKSIFRDPNDFTTYGPIDHYNADGIPIFKDKVNSWMLPALNFGFSPMINYRKLKNSSGKYILRFVANAQFNFANNDILDGYTPLDGNGDKIDYGNDFYRFYSLGIKYSF
ncbi:hypothetical protein [Sphingobacterium rhinopitheci]|uniref:hypothetical protein n=1 Tax=Sphingobacterium rhinopitheci TaxID=2781960 RepID=UPI001F52A9F8|nr:hypothetical protein [Sphingobacterium rhinopitheci]MCI0919827.1 hypothetical protein [Sphingobacterium rhinopitheci]